MSVQKYHPFEEGHITHEPKPYAQVLNYPVQNCTNLEAIGLWVYLQSKSENWKLVPKHIQNHFKICRDKVYELINFLIECNLLKRTVQRCANGQCKGTIYTVLNGENYQYNQECTPLPDLQDPVLQDTVKQDTYEIKELLQNKRGNTKEKIKTLCATDVARNDFNDFWSLYPVKKNKKRARQIWSKLKLEQKSAIIADIIRRLSTEWLNKDHQYIPHPSTYLNGERWKDEITVLSSKEQKFNPGQFVLNQLRDDYKRGLN